MQVDTWIALDVETSGFGRDAQILEVAVVHFWKGRVVRRWSELICPIGLSWTDEKIVKALEVNKLSVEALMYGAATFKKVRERFELEVTEPIWVMQSAMFDHRMLFQEYERLGLEMYKPQYIFDTVEWDKLINPNESGRKLEDLCDRWHVINPSPHRAFGDAEACGLIFGEMLGVLPQDIDELEDMYNRRETLAWRNKIRSL